MHRRSTPISPKLFRHFCLPFQGENGKLLFSLSIINLLFWIIANEVDVYQHAFIGAIFEIAWLPCLLAIGILPTITFWLWYKNKFKLYQNFLSSLALQIALVLYLFLISV